MNKNFPKNLRYLCTFHRSISEVCRRLDINRQQFNKYLNGHSRPSSHNMRRICSFFGVEADHFNLPHKRFAETVGGGDPADQRLRRRSAYIPHIDRLLEASSRNPEPYLGYYFSHFFSFSEPGWILKSLICFFEDDGGIFYKRVERLTHKDQEEPDTNFFIHKYRGAVVFLSDRIFLMDFEDLTNNEISQTILYPTYKNRVTWLTGLTMGVSANDKREPACARIVFQYLGRNIDTAHALGQCGLFHPDSPDIQDRIKQGIHNRMTEGSPIFVAPPQ